MSKKTSSSYPFIAMSRLEKASAATFSVIIFLLVLMFTVYVVPKNRSKEQIKTKVVFDAMPLQKNKEPKVFQHINIQSHTGYNKAEIEKELDEIEALDISKTPPPTENMKYLKKDNYDIAVLSEKIIEKNKQLLQKKTNDQVKPTSVFYNLKGRYRHYLPAPIYTCNASGILVVNIKVDKEGMVERAAVSLEKSSSTNQCLKDQALRYARKAIFNKVLGKGLQTGTITYLFEDRMH